MNYELAMNWVKHMSIKYVNMLHWTETVYDIPMHDAQDDAQHDDDDMHAQEHDDDVSIVSSGSQLDVFVPEFDDLEHAGF